VCFFLLNPRKTKKIRCMADLENHSINEVFGTQRREGAKVL
jgi:hypothetical protein